MKKLLLTTLIILILCLPFFCYAALELEQKYPEVPGIQNIQTITSKTSIPRLIKYYSTWAIVIAILLVIISLLIAGVQYLTSAGRPEVMKSARSRLFKSFLGLAILLSSYLILNTVSPQIRILQIKKIPVESGIVLLTKDAVEGNINKEGLRREKPGEGFEKIKCSDPDWPALKELIEMGEVRYLPSGAASLTKPGLLGILTAVEWDNAQVPQKVNFENFPVYAIGFWGETAQNMKVTFYPEKNFQGEPDKLGYYTFEGEVDAEGEVKQNRGAKTCGSDPEIKVIAIDPDEFTDESEVVFIDPGPSYAPKDHPGGWPLTKILHPPLSLKMEGIGPGVYLYAEESQGYFITSFSDFTVNNLDDKAEEIEIKNKKIVKKKVDTQIVEEVVEKHNYLAILHDDATFKGNLRLFFEKRKLDNFFPNIYLESRFHEGAVYLDDLKGKSDIYENGVYKNYQGATTIGNVPEDNKIFINKIDRYGKINGASSIQVFELAERPSVCKEVKICNQKYTQGYCISYTPNGKTLKGAYQTLTLPMLLYIPIDIPLYLEGTILKPDKTSEKLKIKDWQGEYNKNAQFSDNIKSIQIDGKCLVVLFQNSIRLQKCVDCAKGDDSACPKCWLGGSPGAHSEVFVSQGRFTDMDLSDNPIGYCTEGAGGLEIGEPRPCASAIVVYPIK